MKSMVKFEFVPRDLACLFESFLGASVFMETSNQSCHSLIQLIKVSTSAPIGGGGNLHPNIRDVTHSYEFYDFVESVMSLTRRSE